MLRRGSSGNSPEVNAWLLTWEGTTAPALSGETKIAAILSGRLASRSVEAIVDCLYTRCIWSAYELAEYAHKPRERRQQLRADLLSQP